MTWVVLAVATAVLYAGQGAWTKRLTSRVRPVVASWAIFALAFPFLAVYLALDGLPPTVGVRFWTVLAVNTVLYVLSFHLYATALQRGDLGLIYPLTALTPILVVPVEWLVLGDAVGVRGLVGIALVVGGVYVLNFDRKEAPLLEPFRAVARDPGARRMLAVTVIWSVSGTLDRVAVLEASPAFYGVTVTAAVGALFLPLALRKRGTSPGAATIEASDERGRSPATRESQIQTDTRVPEGIGGGGSVEGGEGTEALATALRRRPGALLVQGLVFAGMFVCQMEALRLSLASFVIAIKRSGTLLSVLFGAAFFGEEKLGWRLLGTAVILAGVLLVAGAP